MLFVCFGFCNCFILFQEIPFREEFFSQPSRLCRGRLLVLVTQCATHDGREKIFASLLSLLLLFACVAVRKIEFCTIINTEREP